jgi:excisionase family DNA binding protein
MTRKSLLRDVECWLRQIIADEISRALNAAPQQTVGNGRDRVALSLKQAAESADLSLSSIKKAVARGELRSRKHGRRTLVLPADLNRYLEALPERHG